MPRHLKSLVWLMVSLCTSAVFALAASAQTDSAIQNPNSNSTVAYVYVSYSNQNIKAFAAAPDGKLTSIPGSPFRTPDVASMAVNAKYLFVTDAVYIYSFSIAPDGAIKQVASINAQQFNSPNNYGGPRSLFLDRSGANVYDSDLYCCGDDNALQSFSLEASTGELSFIGVSGATWSYWEPLSFIGNNEYAYASE